MAGLCGVPAVLQPRGEHPPGRAVYALLQGILNKAHFTKFHSDCPLCSPNIKPLPMNLLFQLISALLFMFPGGSGCSRQPVFPGKRLQSEGGLWQQCGIGVGGCQRVLQLLHGTNRPLHEPGQVGMAMRRREKWLNQFSLLLRGYSDLEPDFNFNVTKLELKCGVRLVCGRSFSKAMFKMQYSFLWEIIFLFVHYHKLVFFYPSNICCMKSVVCKVYVCVPFIPF